MKEKMEREVSERVINICKNLTQTINKIKRTVMDSPFDVPNVKKSTLKRILKKLMDKYNLKKSDL